MIPILCVLDPGHSSKTLGKASPDGALKEYEHNRTLAHFISMFLKAQGVSVEFTTFSEERDVPLTERATRANNYYRAFKAANPNGKAVFISCHSDASGDGSKWMQANGFSVWTTKATNNSDKVAEAIFNSVSPVASKWGMKMRKYSSTSVGYEANFTVIYKANFPAVLIECGFHDNEHDVSLLKNKQFNMDIAEAVANAIINYFQ